MKKMNALQNVSLLCHLMKVNKTPPPGYHWKEEEWMVCIFYFLKGIILNCWCQCLWIMKCLLVPWDVIFVTLQWKNIHLFVNILYGNVNSRVIVTHKILEHWFPMNNYDSTVTSYPCTSNRSGKWSACPCVNICARLCTYKQTPHRSFSFRYM